MKARTPGRKSFFQESVVKAGLFEVWWEIRCLYFLMNSIWSPNFGLGPLNLNSTPCILNDYFRLNWRLREKEVENQISDMRWQKLVPDWTAISILFSIIHTYNIIHIRGNFMYLFRPDKIRALIRYYRKNRKNIKYQFEIPVTILKLVKYAC